MTADAADLECAAADLQHAIHLVGVANRCGDDPARVDVLAEARTLIRCADERLDPPASPDPDPGPAMIVIARDLRIGDRIRLARVVWVVRSIDCHDGVVVVVFRLQDEAQGVGVHARTWSDAHPVHVLTPRPGGERR